MMSAPHILRLRTYNSFRVAFVRAGKPFVRLFNDSYYGSKTKAFEAAVAYREAFLAKNPAPPSGTSLQRPRSNTGYAGISKTYTISRGRRYPCLTVTVNVEANKPVNAKIYYAGDSTTDYERALADAIAWRRHRLDLIATRCGMPNPHVLTPRRK